MKKILMVIAAVAVLQTAVYAHKALISAVTLRAVKALK